MNRPISSDLAIRVRICQTLSATMLIVGCGTLALANDQETIESLARTAARMEKLQRPLNQTTLPLGDFASDRVTPTNRAEPLLGSGQSQASGYQPTTVFLPDRYNAQFQHRPLYFQECDLERCGHTWGCLQNAVSASRFLGNTVSLPLQMLLQSPGQCQDADGDCLVRPPTTDLSSRR